MTTPAQLSAQIVDLMTRWNAQQDQLADWLTGDPAGGPNGDGRFPLTNAEGGTGLFLSLPAVVHQITGPSASAASARDAAQAASSLAEAAQAAAESARAAAEAAKDAAGLIRNDVNTQKNDVAAKWADVGFWHGSVNEQRALVSTLRDETTQARADTLSALTALSELTALPALTALDARIFALEMALAQQSRTLSLDFVGERFEAGTA